MKRAALTLGLALICFSCWTASAQTCGGPSGGTIGSCSSNNCYGQYEQFPPPGGTNLWMKVTVECCSHEVGLWVDEGTGCFADLTQRDKQTIRLLASMGIPLMVRDCKGHFTQVWVAKS
jgi:hypothetical protein